MKRSPKRTWDFYAVQKRQMQRSMILLPVLILFYFILFGFISFVILLGLILFFPGILPITASQLKIMGLVCAALASLIAVIHYIDARKQGARFIRKRLGARAPDTNDRYHKAFINTLEEMRIAAGIPRVNPYVLPMYAINSMALIEKDNTPSILVTEGLLADFPREELQAVIAHEIGHIMRGDTFYMTLVCSLANFFERFRLAVEPDPNYGQGGPSSEAEGGAPLLYFALTVSTLIMHFLSTLISRQREILADAAAVEFHRNPKALACAIYRAQIKNSFVGDFNPIYTPLFIVPANPAHESDGFFNRIFSTHPPLMKRIRLLIDMADISPAHIIREVRDVQARRKAARKIVDTGIPREPLLPIDSEEDMESAAGRIWQIHEPGKGWSDPLALENILFLRFFSPLIRLRNTHEGIEAPAREFPQVRQAMRRIGRKTPVNARRSNKCPRCAAALTDQYYEGVPLKECPRCSGKLVAESYIERIIARREIGFSKDLMSRAEQYRDLDMAYPGVFRRINDGKPSPHCPKCGTRMTLRPFTYHYLIPVDKCFSCSSVWFDTDELEIIQILIENR